MSVMTGVWIYIAEFGHKSQIYALEFISLEPLTIFKE